MKHDALSVLAKLRKAATLSGAIAIDNLDYSIIITKRNSYILYPITVDGDKWLISDREANFANISVELSNVRVLFIVSFNDDFPLKISDIEVDALANTHSDITPDMCYPWHPDAIIHNCPRPIIWEDFYNAE